jgi:hydroxypyruvate reductase
MKMRKDAEKIYTGAIRSCLPDESVREALSGFVMPRGRLVLVAIGKAAWKMARAATEVIAAKGGKIHTGAVLTKYGHSEGEIPGIEIYEAGHPIPDGNGIRATQRILEMTDGLSADDLVLFLISGGGSALFESPKCTLDELQDITSALLRSGADINEINGVRKHLSRVKGGRFAEHISPARVYAIALSDVIGNSLDVIASGPCAPDTSTVEDVCATVKKYGISLSEEMANYLGEETPKRITNAIHRVSGSVSELCAAAGNIAESLGYKVEIISDNEVGNAREIGERLAALAHEKRDTDTDLAYIIGGESVVLVKGTGLGGRNQEIALAAAIGIDGLHGVCVFSIGSDGTDGPTDAAGGYVDGGTVEKMKKAGISPVEMLENNDSYHALDSVGALIRTGATGTNVNDVAVLLIRSAARHSK